MSDLLVVHGGAAISSILFEYRGRTVEKVVDVEACALLKNLTEEEHDDLCYDVATTYISLKEALEDFVDPLIAQYADRCAKRNINIQDAMCEEDCQAVYLAASRMKERTARKNTLIAWFTEHNWNMDRPYLKAVLNGKTSGMRNFTAFVKGMSVKKGQTLTQSAQLQWNTIATAGDHMFGLSEDPVSKEDIEAAQASLNRTIRITGDHTLLAFDMDHPDLLQMPLSRADIADADARSQAPIRTRGSIAGKDNAQAPSAGTVARKRSRGEYEDEQEHDTDEDEQENEIEEDEHEHEIEEDEQEQDTEEDEQEQNTEEDEQGQDTEQDEQGQDTEQDEQERDDDVNDATAVARHPPARAMKAVTSKMTSVVKKDKIRTQKAADILNWKRRCTCDADENPISRSTRKDIEGLESTAKLHKTADEISAARDTAVDIAYSIGNKNVCHSHCFIFATHVGIYKASMLHAQLLQIILHYGQQDDIASYLASDEAALLIKKTHREPNPHNDAGIAQVIPCIQAERYQLDKGIASEIIQEMFPGLKEIWQRDGDVVSDIFGWIFKDEKLVQCIQAEVDMYDYHFRLEAGQSKKGWLCNANFTQIQQLIRMDSLFYAQHVLLHEDHELRFISYPYEMKLAMLGMSTAFSHLDLNVARVIEDLDNVNPYPVPEEHGAVNAGVSFTEAHARKYNTRFRHDILKAGESRISDPRCLHSTDGPATTRRVAVFAWLVQHDGDNLAQPGTGSVEQLSRAYRDLLLGGKLNSPSGHPNKTGIPLEKFPASMQLLSPSAISNAIVGRISYFDISVQCEIDILFGKDNRARAALIENTRRSMLAQIKTNYNYLFKLEEEIFGDDCYHKNEQVFRETNHLQRHTKPTFPEHIDLANFAVKKEKIDRSTAAAATTGHVEEGEEEQAYDSDTEDNSSQGESMIANVTVNETDTLREADKRHPENKYRFLGSGENVHS